MYSTCLFCHADLGRNEAIEQFPVGRRLAFDARKGRLWVVCRRCERWNLSPLEERWEAIEACEREFRETRLRTSTDNIGLARLRNGLELVRIGEPLRPEFAAWRYGDQFGRRRRMTVLKVGLGLGAVGAVVAGGVAAGIGVGGAWWWIFQGSRYIVQGNPNTVVARIPDAGGPPLLVRRQDVEESRLLPHPDGWRFLLDHTRGRKEFTGDAATRALSLVLPAANRYGGSRRQVERAVRHIEEAGGPEAFVHRTAQPRPHRLSFGPRPREPETGALSLTAEERLALEMAAHEESERQAMAGELAILEQAWRDAEEIAKIADDLLLPAGVDDMLRKFRGA